MPCKVAIAYDCHHEVVAQKCGHPPNSCLLRYEVILGVCNVCRERRDDDGPREEENRIKAEVRNQNEIDCRKREKSENEDEITRGEQAIIRRFCEKCRQLRNKPDEEKLKEKERMRR